MTKQLNEIVRESVEKFEKDLLEPANQSYRTAVNDQSAPYRHQVDNLLEARSILISSQISLLEAELDRKKNIKTWYYKHWKDADFNESYTQYSAPMDLCDEEITYLIEQIEECRKLLTK